MQTIEIEIFIAKTRKSNPSDEHLSWAYDYAIIRLYRSFEVLMLNCLVAAINNDTKQLSAKTGRDFPKHLSDEVCEYLIVGNGFFNFKGRDGLIGDLKTFLKDDHFLIEIVKSASFKIALERLSALRNFAAHNSKPSKKSAMKAVGVQRMKSAGAWLKEQDRFERIVENLLTLSKKISDRARY